MKFLAVLLVSLAVFAMAMPSDLAEPAYNEADGQVYAHVAAPANVNAGLTGAISASGLTTIMTKIARDVMTQMKESPIPGESGKSNGFKYDVHDITFKSMDFADTTATINNGIRMGLHGFHTKVHLHWKYKKSKFPWVPFGSGTADVTLEASAFEGTFQITTVQTPNGLRPKVTLQHPVVNLDKLSIKVHGSMFSWLYNLVLGLFKNRIRKTVESAVTTAFITGVQAASDKIINSMQMISPVSTWGSMDVSLTQGATYFNDQHEALFSFNGEVYKAPQNVPDGVVPRDANIPFRASGRMLSTSISAFTLNTAFHAQAAAGLKKNHFDDAGKPAHFPAVLNTNDAAWNSVPALKAKYANLPMLIRVKSNQDPKCSMKPGVANFAIGLDVTVIVVLSGKEVPVFTIDTKASSNLEFSIQQRGSYPAFVPKIRDTAASGTIKDSVIGPFDVNGLIQVLNGVVNLFVLPQVNAQLDSGFPLPAPAGLSFVKPALTINDGHVFFASDLAF